MNVWKLWTNVGKIFNSSPNVLFGTNVAKTHESRWYLLLTISQWTNTTSIFSRRWRFSPYLLLAVFSSVLSSSFKGCQSSWVSKAQDSTHFNLKCNPVLKSFNIYFEQVVFQLLFHASWSCVQNSLECLIWNKIHWVVQILHSKLFLTFYSCSCFCTTF